MTRGHARHGIRAVLVAAGVLAAGAANAGAQSREPSLNTRPALPASKDAPSAVNPYLLPLTEELGVEAAQEKARAQKRLLVIFWCGDGPDDPNWTFCRSSNSLSLRSYIKWHCVAIQTRVLPGKLADQVCATLKAQSQESPAVIVMRDGGIEQVMGCDIPMLEYKNDPMPKCPRYKCSQVCYNVGCNCKQFTPGPLRVLYQTDFALDRIRARDPVWGDLHEVANPPPQAPPEGEPLCTTADDTFAVVRDPRPEEKIGALDRLTEARTALRAGDWVRAASIYTWLWERGSEFDPAFRPARLSAVAEDIAALVGKSQSARKRFDEIRKRRTERMPWAEYGQMQEWFVLSGATGRVGEAVEYLDYFLSDTDEGAIAPKTDVLAMGMMARREDYARAWQLPSGKGASGPARVRGIAERMGAKLPATVTDEHAREYRAFARQYVLDEGARLYTACLVKGDDVGAAEIARQVLATRDDAMARLALITTALSAEPAQARPVHLEWLAQAEGMSGQKRDDLRTRIVLGTGGLRP